VDSFSKKYFENFTPSYSLNNFSSIIDYLSRKRRVRVLDIGCGDGKSLEKLKRHLHCDVYGLEEVETYKIKANEGILKEIYWMSILDNKKIKKINRKFDVIILSRVLHHLVSESPELSNKLSQKAIKNAFSLVKKNGEVIISEPLFEPAYLNRFIFYVKKIFSKLTSKRITLFGYWNNIGAPVVNYFTAQQIKKISDPYRIVEFQLIKPQAPMLIGFFFKRFEVLLILKK